MNFRNGRMQLVAPNREAIYYPLGPTTNTIIDGKVVSQDRPTVFFSQFRYETDRDDVARAMIADKVNFDRRWGYSVMPECLPDELADFWPGLSTETRRAVMLALIDGKPAEAAFELIPESETEPEPEEDFQAQRIVNCPAPSCGASFAGSNGPAALVAHIFAVHPDYKGES